MNFQQAIESGFRNYANFRDRASRSAYWWWVLFTFLGGILTSMLDSAFLMDATSTVAPLNTFFTLATLVPSVAVTARRLHDIDKSGWWQLLWVTFIGIIPLIYWFCQPGQEGDNRFGPRPAA